MLCPKALYVGDALDIDHCLECLKNDKCFHDKPRFNTTKIRNLLESERNIREFKVFTESVIFSDLNNLKIQYGQDNTN